MEILQVDIDRIGLKVPFPTDEDYTEVGRALFKAFEKSDKTSFKGTPFLFANCVEIP